MLDPEDGKTNDILWAGIDDVSAVSQLVDDLFICCCCGGIGMGCGKALCMWWW
jgi:hypothetical protein